MSDWRVGDLAVCTDGRWLSADLGPPTNWVGAVTKVTVRADRIGLSFAEFPDWLHDAKYFRKIRPDEHESCEPEFIELLNRSKRKVSA